MNIVTLFDKSFLQSLSLDESVWFDQYFVANVCPMFFVETLADLQKSIRGSRTSEEEVRIIADKFPEMHGAPNIHHATACRAELLGNPIPLKGQLLLAGGRPVRQGKRTGIVVEDSPEAVAFSRWQDGQFFEVERRWANAWRQNLSAIDLHELTSHFKKLGIDGKSCRSLHEAKNVAERLITRRETPFEKMHLILLLLSIHEEHHRTILKRWSEFNYPEISTYTPYVAHVYMVEIFFRIALAAGLISSERPSNWVDISYLFYLPFCRLFVSSDKLHKRCAEMFLRQDQQFIWGPDLKRGLRDINNHFLGYPDVVRNQGVMRFASRPPTDGQFMISDIWDRHSPGWRKGGDVDVRDNGIRHDDLVEHLMKFNTARKLGSDEIDFDVQRPDAMSIKRMVRGKKGSWLQVPKDIAG